MTLHEYALPVSFVRTPNEILYSRLGYNVMGQSLFPTCVHSRAISTFKPTNNDDDNTSSFPAVGNSLHSSDLSDLFVYALIPMLKSILVSVCIIPEGLTKLL